MNQSHENPLAENIDESFNVLILAPQASARFGGESILPIHYFTRLQNEGVTPFMIVHERTRKELEELLAENISRVTFIKDTWSHKTLFRLSKFLPKRIANFSLIYLIDLLSEIQQKKLARKIINERQIRLIHIPIRVSPKLPSVISDMGVPTLFGPLNGGMDYPQSFRKMESFAEKLFMMIGRTSSNLFNRILPGKRNATAIFVANPRTRNALPSVKCKNIIELVENGVDLDVFDNRHSSSNASITQAANHQNSETIARFTYLGRLVDWKRIDIVIYALNRALRSNPNLHLDIIGDGDQRQPLEALASNLGVSHNITFHGFVPQTQCPELLQQSTCLVLPSIYECGGAVVLEAMAMSKPAIATHWGGPADYLDENCGILISPEKGEESMIEGFSQAMLKLADEPELAKTMGQAGRIKVEREYDWNVKVKKMAEYYRHFTNQANH